jgi:glutamine---fructose-6-phosphate transaminase (isomerizing)
VGADGGYARTAGEGRGAVTAKDRANALLEDVVGEPQMLAALLDAYAAPGGPLAAVPELPASSRVVFAGLGSSRYAALDAATALRGAGRTAWVEFASADVATPPARDVVLVSVSASGSTPETVAAAERHRGTSLVVAVTNRPESPLTQAADVVLPLFAGVETSGVSSRTFLATAAVLALLTGWPVDALRPAVDGLERLLVGRAEWLPPAADAIDGAEAIGILAPAGLQGVAEQAALLLREGPRLRASAHEATDWAHTAIYTALPGYRAVLLPGIDGDDTLAGVIAGRGGAVVRAPPVAEPARLVVPAFADLLSVELWSRTVAQRKEP